MNANLRTGLIVLATGALVYLAWRAWRSQGTSSAGSSGTGELSRDARDYRPVPGGRVLNPTGDDLGPPQLDPTFLLDCPGCGPEHPPLVDGMFEDRPTGLLTGGEDPGTNVTNPSLGKFMKTPLAWQTV